MPNWDVLATATLSSAGNFSFSNIPQTYKELVLVGSLRASSGSPANCTLNINGNSNAIYYSLLMYGMDSTAAMATNGNAGTTYCGIVQTSTFSPHMWRFVNYTDTSHHKNFLGWHGSAANAQSFGQVRYEINVAKTTAAITSLTLGVNGSSHAAGSQLTLYGLEG